MELVSSEYVTRLATTLMTQVLGAAAGHVRKTFTGTEKEQALRRCLDTGIVALLTTLATTTLEEQRLVVDIFRAFFDDPRVGIEIGELLRGQALNVEELAELFGAVGYEASTLPGVNFTRAIEAFEAAFLVAAQEESALQGTMQTAQLMAQTHLQRGLLEAMRELVTFMRSARPGSVGVRGNEVVAVREDTGQPFTHRLDPRERQRLKDEFGAQLLMRDARAAMEQRDWDQAERVTREALDLDADLVGARSALGLAMSDAVASWFGREHGERDVASELQAARARGRALSQDEFIPVIEAILWLDEAQRHGDDPHGRISLALALMYGVTRRYRKMIDALRRALQVNRQLAPDLCRSECLIMLAHGCDSDPEQLRELGGILGIPLPASKADVQRSIEEMDLRDASIDAYGIVWAVMGQPTRWVVGPSPRFPAPVRIHARDEAGGRQARACFTIPIPYRPLIPHCIPQEPGEYRAVSQLVDELADLFLFVGRL